VLLIKAPLSLMATSRFKSVFQNIGGIYLISWLMSGRRYLHIDSEIA